jgi:hypothetical protein
MVTAIAVLEVIVRFDIVIDRPKGESDRIERELAPAGLGIDLGMSMFGRHPIGVLTAEPAQLGAVFYPKLGVVADLLHRTVDAVDVVDGIICRFIPQQVEAGTGPLAAESHGAPPEQPPLTDGNASIGAA